MTPEEKKQQEQEEWIRLVHEGSCCADTEEDEQCPVKEKPEESEGT